tara:strand:- start:403 stop:894 length:492 start_codon:yes stop_codon:yes gene_type:complete
MISSETDQFLKFRPNTKYIEEVKHLPNTNYETSKCENMSAIEAEKSLGSVAEGWLVGDMNSSTSWYCNIKRKSVIATPIIRHTWNINNNGIHYDTVDYRQSDKINNFQYVMDLNIDKFYIINDEKFYPRVLFLSDTNLMIQKKDGIRHTITKEEHERFYNEVK